MLCRRVLTTFLCVLLIAVVGVAVRYYPDWEWMVEHEQQFRERVCAAPIENWCVGLGIYFAFSLIPGTGGKSVIAGWLFGFWAALIMIELGLTSAAVVSFLLGRYALRELLRSRWKARLRVLSQRFLRDGAFTLLLLRLAHAPFTLINYGAGCSKIPLTTFWWTTHVGILPGTVVFAFVGARIPSLRAIADEGAWALLDWPLIAALLMSAASPFVLRPILRSWFRWAHRRRQGRGRRQTPGELHQPQTRQ